MRYAMIGAIVAVVIVAGIVLMPAQKAEAGSYHWEAGAAMQNQHGEWVIWAELKDGNGDVVQTVQTGTTDGRRKSRKASKELADSLNEAGSGFKWDPACEGEIFLC